MVTCWHQLLILWCLAVSKVQHRKENLVVVKVAELNLAGSTVVLVVDGWRWVINDIIQEARQSKALF